MQRSLNLETIKLSFFYQNTFKGGTLYVDGFEKMLDKHAIDRDLDQVDFALHLINECKKHLVIPREELLEFEKLKPHLFNPHYLNQLKEQVFKIKCGIVIADALRGNAGHVLIDHKSAVKRVLSRKEMKLTIQSLNISDHYTDHIIYLCVIQNEYGVNNLVFSLDQSEFMMFKLNLGFDIEEYNRNHWEVKISDLIYKLNRKKIQTKMLAVS